MWLCLRFLSSFVPFVCFSFFQCWGFFFFHLYPFLKMTHISNIIWYLPFCVWLTSLSVKISRSIHVAANGSISFFSRLSNYSIIYMYHIFLSFVDTHLYCFYVLAVVNSAAVNTGVYISFLIMVMGIRPGVGLLGHMVVLILVF